MTMAQIEKRLAALESQMATLRAPPRDAQEISPLEMFESIRNTIPNDADSREAARLGRKWRLADRPSRRRRRVRKSRK